MPSRTIATAIRARPSQMLHLPLFILPQGYPETGSPGARGGRRVNEALQALRRRVSHRPEASASRPHAPTSGSGLAVLGIVLVLVEDSVVVVVLSVLVVFVLLVVP